MTKIEALIYEASNDILLRSKSQLWHAILHYLLKMEWFSDWNSSRIANKVNRKWERFENDKMTKTILQKLYNP